jgi:drug/metabolite transporter (DMT)-like permease
MLPILSRLGRRLFDAPYLLLVLTMLFWSGNLIVGRYVAGHVPPVALGTLRWIGATLIVIGFALPFLRADWKTIRANAGILTILSLSSISAFNTLSYYGLQYTEAINALLLGSTAPPFIALWALLLFGDRLSRGQLIGMLICVAGLVAIVCRGDLTALLAVRFNPGDIFILAAIAAYALYSVLLRLKPPMHPLSFLTLTMGWGSVLLLPVYAWEISTGYVMQMDTTTVLALIYVIVFPSLLAHFFFFRGVELIGANRAAPWFYLTQIFGSAGAIVFLGERLRLYHVVGYALIVAGITIATRWAGTVRPSAIAK